MAKRIKKRKNRPAQRAAQKVAQRDVRSTLRADAPQIPENREQTTKRAALSGWPMVLAWMAMLIFTIHACTHMVAAGDTWVAMACGRHFVNHGVDTVEPFSANSHKPGPTEQEVKTWPDWAQWITEKVGLETVKKWHPTGWVNQNWLTHVIFYSLIPKSSYADGVSFPSNALVYWKFAIYIITVICVFYMGVLLGVNPALSAVFTCFAMFIGRSFLDVRPAGFSNMLVAVFLLILLLATYRNILYIWLIVPVTVFWCNVHGGYIYVFIMLVPFVGLNFLTTFSKKTFVSIGLKGSYHTIAAGFAAFIATVIFNPFHLTNLTHTFVISVSEHAARWRDIHEWHPAFEWANPVGTAFPFLVMFILSVGLFTLWLFSRFFKPRFLKAPKNEIKAQQTQFTLLFKISGILATVLVCWVVSISFSLLSLDALSFLLCALFAGIFLLSVHVNVHYIHLAVILTLMAVWSGKPETGYSGRYIYPFLIIPGYVLVHTFARLFSKSLTRKHINILFVIIPAVVSLLLMVVLFDPFNFTRLFDAGLQFGPQLDRSLVSEQLRRKFDDHGIPLSPDVTITTEELGAKWLITDKSNSYSATREQKSLNIYVLESPLWHMDRLLHLRRVWHPRYEGPARLDYSLLFPILYIANLIAIVLWLTLDDLRNALRRPTSEPGPEPSGDAYQSPKIDLAHMTVAALTIYMAIRSRRFIPIAAIAACPIIAMLIHQAVCVTSAARNFYTRNRLAVSPVSELQRSSYIVAGAIAVIFFGTWWGLGVKRVYLDPWPNDPKLNSVFMRMTASDAKPFYATKFMKLNRMKGKMFNYWTEGGAIAFGQEPDPNTGFTPLRLFMDGRAQAAYDRPAFERWTVITSGGPTVHRAAETARLQNKRIEQVLTTKDYIDIGQWISDQIREYNVWVVLMPAGQFSKPFTRGLEHNRDWPVVFMNNKQKIFVDITTPQGKMLYQGIFTAQTRYPDQYHKDLMLGHNYLLQPDKNTRKRGFDLLKAAFDANPSPAPMLEAILIAARSPELIPLVTEFCSGWVADFTDNKQTYLARDGYRLRLEATRLATVHLQKIARTEKKQPPKLAEILRKYPQADADGNRLLSDAELANFYLAQMEQYVLERNRISQSKRW
ncbi:MAG: hypothetical protein KAY65_10470 [Planctomycetes bacterium]|nr:hypothetical protein [Planctomycetota bacterium]